MQDGLRRELGPMLPRLRRFARGLTGGAAAAGDALVETACARLLTEGAVAGPAGRLDHALFGLMITLWVEPRAIHSPWQEGDAPSSGLDAVRAAFAALGCEQRTLLLLIGVEGLSYRECAALLGLSLASVAERLAAARLALVAGVDAPAGPIPPPAEDFMTRPGDEGLLCAYVDGELDETTARTVETWVAAETSAGAILRRLHDSAGMVRAALGGTVEEPLPPTLAALIAEPPPALPAPQPVSGRPPMAARPARHARLAAGLGAGALVSLAVGAAAWLLR